MRCLNVSGRVRSALRLQTGACGLAIAVAFCPVMQAYGQGATSSRVRPLHVMNLTKVYEIDADQLDANRVSAVSAGPNGVLVSIDSKDLIVSAFNSQTGARIGRFGRKGQGPGEFSEITAAAWLHDTLVVLDGTTMRLTLYSVRDGRLLGTTPIDRGMFERAFPIELIQAGSDVYVGFVQRSGSSRKGAFGGIRAPAPAFRFARVAANSIAPFLVGAIDSLEPIEDVAAVECIDASKNIHLFHPPFPDLGPLHTITSDGRLVTALRDSGVISVLLPDRTRERFSLPVDPVLTPRPLWELQMAPYRKVADKVSVTCSPVVEMPRFLPTVRQLQNDGNGRLLLQLSSATGFIVAVVEMSGKVTGAFSMPVDIDQKAKWSMRGNMLYIVAKNTDGLQRVIAYRVGN